MTNLYLMSLSFEIFMAERMSTAGKVVKNSIRWLNSVDYTIPFRVHYTVENKWNADII